MPIRPEFRHFYRGPGWAMTRARILARAGGRFTLVGEYLGGARCENCSSLDGLEGIRDQWGQFVPLSLFTKNERQQLDPDELVKIQIGVAHLNHTPGDDRDDNLAAWCRRCHLLYDADFHSFNRAGRKDAARPLLCGIAERAALSPEERGPEERPVPQELAS
jgi:hypothetical protein